MITRRWTLLFVALLVPIAASAQGPRSGAFPWWDSPMVNGLDLTDGQRSEIRSVLGEYRGKMLEVRSAVLKAESELDQIFNEDTVDQRRGSEAIDRLTKARADMTKSVSEMSLRMRAVLTAQQWQELQRRQREQGARLENAGRRSGPPGGAGRGRRLAKGSKDATPRTDGQTQTPPPALQ